MFENKETRTVKNTTTLQTSNYNPDVDSSTLSGTNMAIIAGIVVAGNVVTEATKAGVSYLTKKSDD